MPEGGTDTPLLGRELSWQDLIFSFTCGFSVCSLTGPLDFAFQGSFLSLSLPPPQQHVSVRSYVQGKINLH